MNKVRATRHNGRKGKNGVFKAGHNDRSFNIDNAEHVEKDRCYQNVYWDCYQGFNIADPEGNRPERKFNFEQVEHAFYSTTFGDSIDAQNERHIQSRHKERIREVDDVLNDPKTCPEESVYQLGTKDGHEDPALFVQVAAELFEEMNKRYSSNFKILDWALHMDEATPHIHERHVFFADDGHGMLFPKQAKACEALGFEPPDPDKKEGPKNNRKMSFDTEVRRLFIEIAEKHGVIIEKIPLEGKTHLEKNDFILAKQEEEIRQNQEKIDEMTLKISDLDTFTDEVAQVAYEKAVETVTDTVRKETTKADMSLIERYGEAFRNPKHHHTREQLSIADRIIKGLTHLLKEQSAKITATLKNALSNPEIRQKNQEEIAKAAKTSVLERLAQAKKEVAERNATLPHHKIHRDNERN